MSEGLQMGAMQAVRKWWGFGHADLRCRPFPIIDQRAWQQPDETLETLRVWAEEQAEDAIEWYLSRKRAKRLGSRAFRGLAIVLVVAGGLVPLITAAAYGESSGIGYIFLATAAGCVAFDRFFGLSAGWIRDIETVQMIQRRLERFRFDWAAVGAVGQLSIDGLSTASNNHSPNDRLEMIRAFSADIGAAIGAETAEWQAEFLARDGDLRNQTAKTWP